MMGAVGVTKGLSWGWLWRAREAGDGSEGLDEDRSKDGDEGRDDVVGKSVSIWGRRRWDFQQR